MNPFYLNYGLIKEAMLAARAANSLAIQLVRIGVYVTLQRPVMRSDDIAAVFLKRHQVMSLLM